MAKKRMYSPKIVESDEFLDMPDSAKTLYFYLNLNADDDGFVQPKRIMRMISSTDDNLKLLIAKSFIVPFASGVVVLTHWNENNFIRKDRYTPTLYLQEKAQLQQDSNGFYLVNQMVTSGQPSIDKIRLDKIRLDKERGEEKNTLTSINTEEIFRQIAEVNQVPITFVESKYEDLVNYTESTGKKYKDYLAALRNWVKKDAEKLRKEEYHVNKRPPIIAHL